MKETVFILFAVEFEKKKVTEKTHCTHWLQIGTIAESALSTPGTPSAAGQQWLASESHWSLHKFLLFERRGSASRQACLSRNPSRQGPEWTEENRVKDL